jgi:ABC-2 type transport system ATP-binding protein
MSLVEKIANKVFLINRGQEVYNGSLTGIYEAFGKKHIIDLLFKSPVTESIFNTLSGLESVNQVNDCQVQLTFGQETDLNKVLAELSGFGGISNITSHKPDLHDIFLQLVKTHRK